MEFLRGQGDYADALCPDLILLDLNLPRVNSREVLREIKMDPRLKTIPVVILTSSKEEEDICRAYGDHANCYVTKPVRFDL
jgi:CheY-like chemotaxis protein